jgi:hypothetical protein
LPFTAPNRSLPTEGVSSQAGAPPPAGAFSFAIAEVFKAVEHPVDAAARRFLSCVERVGSVRLPGKEMGLARWISV